MIVSLEHDQNFRLFGGFPKYSKVNYPLHKILQVYLSMEFSPDFFLLMLNSNLMSIQIVYGLLQISF